MNAKPLYWTDEQTNKRVNVLEEIDQLAGDQINDGAAQEQAQIDAEVAATASVFVFPVSDVPLFAHPCHALWLMAEQRERERQANLSDEQAAHLRDERRAGALRGMMFGVLYLLAVAAFAALMVHFGGLK